MRFKLVEENQKTIQRFIDQFGQERYDKFSDKSTYAKLQNLKDENGKKVNISFDYLIANKSPDYIDNLIDRAENKQYKIDIGYDYLGVEIPKPTNTKDLLYNEKGIQIYLVTDVEDMIDLGKDTTWCIAGRYGDEDKEHIGELSVAQARHYFKGYLMNEADWYYVVITPNTKFCVLKKDGRISSIWNQQDKQISLQEFRNICPEGADYFGIRNKNKYTGNVDFEGVKIPELKQPNNLIYNKDGIKIYEVTDVANMIDLGKDTKWAVSGRCGSIARDIPAYELSVALAKNEFDFESYDHLIFVIEQSNQKYLMFIDIDSNIIEEPEFIVLNSTNDIVSYKQSREYFNIINQLIESNYIDF